MSKLDEVILVAPRETVFEKEVLAFQGATFDDSLVNEIIENMNKSYSTMRRGDAEENKLFKQPIPYAVIKRGEEIFVYERLSGGGEARLHSKLSIGVGGHCNSIEGLHSFHDVMYENVCREISEELNISGDITIKFAGLINDDSNEVGEVHLGILLYAEVDASVEVTVRETDQLKGQFMNAKELTHHDNYIRLENWSQIVVDNF